MSGIGISPCPPFAKPSLIPGVLYDGNTVAWYKHNDPVAGVVKDGANRVSFWLDKMNYGIGAELVNQAAWFTAAYWDNVLDINWSQAGNTLVSNGNSGLASRLLFFTIGKTYKVTFTVNVIAGQFNAPYDGIGGVQFSTVVSGTYTYYYTASATSLIMASVLFNGSVTALSIKEVTGKHLLQTTAASQPLWSAANGVLFDGVNDFMKATAFAFVQPEFIYFVGRQITRTFADSFFDGDGLNTGRIYQDIPPSNLIAFNGIGSLTNGNLPLNTFGIIRLLFNTPNSIFQINKTAAILGNFGVNDMNNFTIGSDGAATTNGNIEVKEIILRKSVDNVNTQDSIFNYLQSINGIII